MLPIDHLRDNSFSLPGQNRFLVEFAHKFKLPLEAVRGGAETMYPEYRAKVSAMPRCVSITTK